MSAIAFRNYRIVASDFDPTPIAELSKHPERTGIYNLQEVSFASIDGIRLAGWYVPSQNRAAVVLTHGTSADRSSMLAETRILSNAGFGVLAFDWPGVGASQGTIGWSHSERSALHAAVSWLAERADVDANKIGGLGFSMGGYIMAQVAAEDTRLRAVVLAAAPPNYAELIHWHNRKWGPLSKLPGDWALAHFAWSRTDAQPIELVQKIAPRPVLILGGDADATVPEFMTRELYLAARAPKSLWIVPHANHGNYANADPKEYEQRLASFFTRYLNVGSVISAEMQ
jgi:dipeptidyl aminopeptidase/acylaminoacyl peptidase